MEVSIGVIMTKKQKLELTWIGKGEELKLEPRILIEDPEKSYGDPDSENMLIHGDNLLALKALEQDFSGQIKCIYIDPPYNINAAGIYDDTMEHSLWLSLMRKRLIYLSKLLRNDGAIFVQIDDEMFAYLQLLMDEVFGKSNRLNTIAVKMSEASGVKMAHVDKRLPKLKEYIIAYKKSSLFRIEDVPLSKINKWNDEYKVYLENFDESKRAKLAEIINKDVCTTDDVVLANDLLKDVKMKSLSAVINKINLPEEEIEDWKFNNSWRIVQAVGSSSVKKYALSIPREIENDIGALLSPKGKLYLFDTNFNVESKSPRIQIIFADENVQRNAGDFWSDIKTTGGVGAEGGNLFPNGKKPEKLVERVIALSSSEGDYVLDSFLGSGTTAAVAHKMRRKWIGIELDEHAYTHCMPRIKSVVDGTDQSGITSSSNWRGGGGYKLYELAPSLLKQDSFGNWVISKDYNANMLAHAMAKQEGFTYNPSQTTYWQQGFSTEKDFIFTTTQYISVELMDSIHSAMQIDESLLIACKAFDEACNDRYDNITIKKIPQILLGRCEFGKEDYSLNISENTNNDSTEADGEKT